MSFKTYIAPEQDTVDLLEEAGAQYVTPTGSNKFRIGDFANGRRVTAAYYGGFGGWQFQFSSPAARNDAIVELSRQGVRAVPAPKDTTDRRLALGHDRRVALTVARHLAGTSVQASAQTHAATPTVRAATTLQTASPGGVRPRDPGPEIVHVTPKTPTTALWDAGWSRADVEALKDYYDMNQLVILAKAGLSIADVKRYIGLP